ncbi:hypothetical protein PG995_007849 [Apiospora arundinis]
MGIPSIFKPERPSQSAKQSSSRNSSAHKKHSGHKDSAPHKSSSSSHKHSPKPGNTSSSTSSETNKSHSKKGDSSKSSLVPVPEVPYVHITAATDGAEEVYRRAEEKANDPTSLIVAVVMPEDEGPLMSRVVKAPRTAKRATMYVTTPWSLQGWIRSLVQERFTTFFIFVSPAVQKLAYDIPEVFKDVQIIPCGNSSFRQQDQQEQLQLRIDSSSKYCGKPSYLWEQITSPDDPCAITHRRGCYFDISTCMPKEIEEHFGEPKMMPGLSEDDLAKIQRKLFTVEPDATSVPRPSEQPTSTGGSWFEKWKSVLASVMFAKGFYSHFAGVFWCSGTGIYVKGPLGLAIGAHTFTAGGALFSASAGAGLMAAAGIMYFIPWDRVFSYLKAQLWRIWEKICQIADWIREKLKTLASTVMDKVYPKSHKAGAWHV